MSQNWMRHFELQLIDDKGDGISLSDFKVTFNIQKMPATIFNEIGRASCRERV